ncbi:uridine kinase family protein [Streptomyces sp. NPDC001970]
MSPAVPLDPDRAAAGLRALPPSCGPVRLIAIDGHAGSGKSTLAGLLADALAGAPVLHLDDLATHDELFEWTGRLLDQVIGPLSRGESALYEPYDWNLRRFGTPRPLPAEPVVLVEGVGAGRRALRPHLARLLWMDRGPRESWVRGRHRDGPALSGFWDAWIEAETRHFADDPSHPFADTLVRERSEGYEWLPGPGTTAGPSHFLTERDGPSFRTEQSDIRPGECPNSA